MKAQKPAQGVLLHRDLGDMKSYDVVCDCGDPDHTHNILVDADDFCVTVTISTVTNTGYWWHLNWWQKFVKRLKITYDLWVKGQVQWEASIVLTEQTAFNYAETLKTAVADVQKFKGKK